MKRKRAVRNKKPKPILFGEGWEVIEQGVTKMKRILEGLPEPPFTSEEYMKIYTTIHNMCIQSSQYDYTEKMYIKYKEVIKEYITSVVLPSLKDKHDEFFRFFIKRNSLPSLDEVAFTSFRDQVYKKTKGKVKDAAISLIDQERCGEQIDRGLLKNVIEIFVEIGMGKMNYYKNDFEEEMLKETAAYYSRKASNWILVESFPDYMLKVEECLRREKDRVVHYLHVTSEPKLIEHVTVQGTTLVKKADDVASNKEAEKRVVVGLQEQTFVREVIELHDKNMPLVNDCFQNHTLFHKGLKEAFEIFLNKTVAGSSTAELLVNYCDNILKKGGSEKYSDEAIEQILEKAVNLLGYIYDKDLFVEFYRKKLARRLLFDKSANEDHERSILTKLKQQNGAHFTSKLEGMVTDMILTRETQADFKEYLQYNPHTNPGIDLSVTVLTTGFWPSYRSSDFHLPFEMTKCIQAFKEFYPTKTNSRKLTWIYSLGTCNITAKFELQTIELIVTTYQAAVLLLFNDSDRLSYSEIMSQLNLADDDVVRLLQSLCCLKYKILNKEPNINSISSDDVFAFNSKFTNKMRRIRIPLPIVDEKKKILEVVDKDRKYVVDACLIRIMKSRKVLNHQQLITECVEQLKVFKQIQNPTAIMIARTAVAQDDTSGDGTTSTVLFIGELMKQSEQKIGEGMHPRVLVDGFEIAKRATLEFLEKFKTPAVMGDSPDKEILKMVARTTLRTKLYESLADQLTDVVVDALKTSALCYTLIHENLIIVPFLGVLFANISWHALDVLCIRKPDEPIDLFMVEIMHMRHKFDVDTRLVEGLVLDHGSRHPDMKRRAENCYILTCNVSLEYDKSFRVLYKVHQNIVSRTHLVIAYVWLMSSLSSEINAGFFYSNAEQREKMVAAERRQVCSDNDKNFLVINQKGIDPPSLDLLARAGLHSSELAKRRNMQRLVLACGGEAVNSVDDLTVDCLGWAGLVYEHVLGEEKYTFVENVKNPRSCKDIVIFIAGPNDHTIAQIKDAVRDGLRSVKNTIEDEAVVLGAGAFEVAARQHLINNIKKTVQGRAQIGVEAFADALLVVPKTLAENSGHDTLDAIISITGEHDRGNIVGLNLHTGTPVDPQMEGIFDNYSVKRQLINSGPVIASQLLLVDEVIRAGRNMRKPT
ncbi:hypothetical protein ZIOFF_002116 [Zingiber officinale]|uniref:Cullin family profile domain-containing protein n=1 Tax=Zingiber officinale TaxID=94328 RepID=A0A8J5IPP0_ZINOF|nr:hypothetical protein ZIOFF_002116 [Zingiber officinale]